jgi:hypothetical protein
MHIKLDLTYSMKVLSCYSYNFSSIHCILIKRVLKYVIEITNVDLRFSKRLNDLNVNNLDDLVSYNDSDFVDLKDKCHSIDDFVFMLIDEIISHLSKQQQTIALSSCKIKYMTLCMR